jgi:hypothetical protein
MKKLMVVADWAADSLTCQEVRSTVEGFLQDPISPLISFVSSTPSTIHAGFLLFQLIETEERYGRPLDSVFFVNSDTRLHSSSPLVEAQGSEFIIVRLKSGIRVMGPNAGYSFSFIKDKIDVVYTYPGLDKGSQFRSRDLYARVAAHLMDDLDEDLELEITRTEIIPETTDKYIVHVDNFGNLKTNIGVNEFKETYSFGDYVQVTMNHVTQKVKFVDNMFGATPGELVIYPGSSGMKDNPYLEISSWVHFDKKHWKTGVHYFENPIPGEIVVIE